MGYQKTKYTDEQLYKKTQNLHLDLAGFIIKLTFKSSEQVIYKKMLIESIEEVWGRGGFLKKSSKNYDFEIEFESNIDKLEIVEREEGKKHYHLSSIRNFRSKKITCFYNISLSAIHLIIREILGYLLEDNGLVLHASSCLDKKKKLSIFLAPSGGGKSTTADLLTTLGHRKFSDDLLIARIIKGKWVFYSPPFVEKDTYPSKNISRRATFYIIKKAKNTSRKSILEHKKLIKYIIQQLWLRREVIAKNNLENAMKLVGDHKFYRLDLALGDKKLGKIIK